MLTELSGQIERITYTNEENGFTIARIKVNGQRDLVTVVGNLMAPTPGEILNMRGEWVNHPKFGEQFKVVEYKSAVPATVYGIKKYLGSGLIKGLGPVMAGRIVKKFGKNTLDVIEDEIEKLAQVEGIGKKRIAMIRNAWDEQKEIRDVMLFLQSYGVSSGYATKIFKQYGSRSIAVVTANPYRLATDIFGIGFVIADGIAEKLGFSKDSPLRVEAGILYVLHQLSDEGHVYFP
ncbi:ATP-dependent RecD-like DNA helicase, partial [Candidatus Woesebacteria bacterium]